MTIKESTPTNNNPILLIFCLQKMLTYPFWVLKLENSTCILRASLYNRRFEHFHSCGHPQPTLKLKHIVHFQLHFNKIESSGSMKIVVPPPRSIFIKI